MTITTSPGATTGAQHSSTPTSPQSSRATGEGGAGAPPPRRRPSWPRRRPSFSGKNGRALAITLVALAVIALAVPLGLARLSARGGSASEASVARGAPAQVQRDASGSAGSSGSSGLSEAPGASGSEGSAGSAGSAGGSGTAGSPQASNDSSSKVAGGPLLSPEASAALDATKIARTAWIGLQVTDLAGSAGRARIIASGAGGTVLSEDVVTAVDPVGSAKGASETGPDGIPTTDGGGVSGYGSAGTWPSVGLNQARLTMSVPAEKLDAVLTQLSALGTVSYRSAQAEDVTATYIDTQARIGPARDSITRVRALMAKATDLQQLLVLESELTRRQSDLDALTQQLADLDKRTTMSQVTVAMWTPAAAAVVDEGTGVVGGLRGAWEALLASLTVILTGLAVLLPWLLLIGLGALIALRVVRRRRGTATASASVTSPATASNPAASPPSAAPSPAATTPSSTD